MTTTKETTPSGLGNLVFFGTPAYGHVNPTLPMITEFIKHGYEVTYYVTEEFRQAIESCGATFRAYDFGEIPWTPQVGSRILELTELLLRFTDAQIEELIGQTRELCPVLILHDTIAFWGRAVAQTLGIRAVSVNTIITAYRYTGKAFFLYATRFTGTSLLELRAIPGILKYRRRLRKRYGIKRTDLLGVLMNEEAFNVFTYPRQVHPEGNRKNLFFLGPSAVVREDDFEAEEEYLYDNLIYVSLGTIFNAGPEFYRAVLAQFNGTKYTVVISCGKNYEWLKRETIPSNVIVKPYVNQKKVMARAKAFITAGGMNSICEAAAYGVPCLMYPHQGEQALNAKMFRKLGLGNIIRNERHLLRETEKLLEDFRVNPELVSAFSEVRFKEFTERLENYQKTGEC
mgnify:CR=1 FL=1